MADVSNQSAVILSNTPKHKTLLKKIQFKFKEIETEFKCWVSKQSLVVEAAVVTATGSIQGAALGGIMGALNGATPLPSVPPNGSGLNPLALESFQQAQLFELFQKVISARGMTFEAR